LENFATEPLQLCLFWICLKWKVILI